jgi:hypothetical protein
MKKYRTTCLQLFLVVLLMNFTAMQSKAMEIFPIDETSPCETVGEWKLMSQEDGISISCSTITCDEETYLAIKFENSNPSDVRLIWSLTDDSQNVIITEDEMQEELLQLASNEIHIFKGNYLVKANDQTDFSNFKISIKTLKNYDHGN